MPHSFVPPVLSPHADLQTPGASRSPSNDLHRGHERLLFLRVASRPSPRLLRPASLLHDGRRILRRGLRAFRSIRCYARSLYARLCPHGHRRPPYCPFHDAPIRYLLHCPDVTTCADLPTLALSGSNCAATHTSANTHHVPSPCSPVPCSPTCRH